MGRIFGILTLLISLWIGMQVYLKGTQHALGGAFASFGSDGARDPNDRRTTPQRAGDAVQDAQRVASEKLSRLLPD